MTQDTTLDLEAVDFIDLGAASEATEGLIQEPGESVFDRKPA